MEHIEKLDNQSNVFADSNWIKSSHKSNSSFIQRKDDDNSVFGIEMTSQEKEDVLVERFHLPKACCCCVSISTGSAGLKEKK